MNAPHRIRIEKAKGLRIAVLLFSGRGLWLVSCSTCPDLGQFAAFRTHDRAVLFAAAHLKGHAKADASSDQKGVLLARVSRDPDSVTPALFALVEEHARLTNQKASDVIETFRRALETPINGGRNA